MSHGIGDANAICPYYIREAQYQIVCEGPMEHMKAALQFPSVEEKEKYQWWACCTWRYLERCPHARDAEAKYQE